MTGALEYVLRGIGRGGALEEFSFLHFSFAFRSRFPSKKTLLKGDVSPQ